MNSLRDLPEIAGLDARRHIVRIPPELDVPLTPRVRRIIDTAEFRRLARISQLGLVSLVYPGATHSRFEHSLGVYRLALLLLQQLSHDGQFCEIIGPREAELLIVAALVHDLGHWPFCHPIEDIRLSGLPKHESLASGYLQRGELAEAIACDWRVEPAEVARLLCEPAQSRRDKILASLLSGPIDVDKMDYLQRDSLHCGVPYGRNFDQQRLLGSVCLNESGDGLAISDKGKTAAEMMVFARYVMFSEVYWHHGVRSATAMLQRAVYLLSDQLDWQRLFEMSEPAFIAELQSVAANGPAGELTNNLFGSERRLYKRLARYSLFEEPDVYRRLAQRPYAWLVRRAEELAELASRTIGQTIAPHEILLDAPPVEREVEFNVDVRFTKENRFARLGSISPVVRTLAQEQFDDYVKRVRVFCHARVANRLRSVGDFSDLISRAIDTADADQPKEPNNRQR